MEETTESWCGGLLQTVARDIELFLGDHHERYESASSSDPLISDTTVLIEPLLPREKIVWIVKPVETKLILISFT